MKPKYNFEELRLVADFAKYAPRLRDAFGRYLEDRFGYTRAEIFGNENEREIQLMHGSVPMPELEPYEDGTPQGGILRLVIILNLQRSTMPWYFAVRAHPALLEDGMLPLHQMGEMLRREILLPEKCQFRDDYLYEELVWEWNDAPPMLKTYCEAAEGLCRRCPEAKPDF